MATQKEVNIAPPNIKTALFTIRGTAPLVQNKFSAKAREMMKAKQEAGSVGKKGQKREAKDFQQCYRDAMHISAEGWHGIPAPAFRNALISACRICGFMMTRAKLAVFIEADGFDVDDSSPLVRITKGVPEYFERLVRLETGVADIRPSPKFAEGWECELKVRFDADQFSGDDIANLLLRAGMQVGVGEGRPDSKSSNGMGWGTFEIVNPNKE
jgi:hypothetical protein